METEYLIMFFVVVVVLFYFILLIKMVSRVEKKKAEIRGHVEGLATIL